MQKLLTLIIFLLPHISHAASSFSIGGLQFIETNPALALVGLGLIILEFMLPTKGLLGILGIAFFALGTSSMARTPDAMLHLTWLEVVVLNVLVVGAALFIAYKTWRDYNGGNSAVTEPLLRQHATIIDWNDRQKRVEIGGAIWSATADQASFFNPGDKVVVTAHNNLTLTVAPVSGE